MPSMPMLYHLGSIILLVDLVPTEIGYDSNDSFTKEQVTVAKNKLTSTTASFSNITNNDYVEASSDYKELLTKAGWEIKSVQYPKMAGEGGTVYHPGDTFDEISGADATYITIEAVTPATPETWMLNKLGTSTLGNETFNVSFKSNNTTYSKIVCDRFETEALYYDSTKAWQTGEWRNEAYRTIIFDSPVTDTTLLTWLQANGTKQETDISKKLTKLKYKVSDVCQLFDKDKYFATRTAHGVVFTNNGDGSFTINGTCDSDADADTPLFLPPTGYSVTFDLYSIEGHKYLLIPLPQAFSYSTLCFIFGSQATPYYETSDTYKIYTATKTGTYPCYAIYRVGKGTTINNLTVKPQLFDLTEMYGAANEPTTLAEFRQKYPNDLYPYSPQCWYSINKTRYITPTKNLFNINNGFIRQTRCNGVIENGVATITATAVNASYYFAKVDVEVGKTYIVSADWTTTGYSLGLFVSNESSYDTFSYGRITETTSSIKIVATGTELYLKGYVTYDVLPAVARISNIQVEENSVKTNYVPYGYLPLNKGVKI